MDNVKRKELESMLGAVRTWGYETPADALEKFITYHDLILARNETAGLVSPKDAERIIPRHFVESLSLAQEIKFHPALIVMDFGCGAGFPSIPLKIIFPDFPLYLVEANRKKALFLDKLIEDIGLENAILIAERGEGLHSRAEYRGTFDVVFARAVGPLSRIALWCVPFLSEHGRLIIPGSPVKDLHQVEEAHELLGGIHQIRLRSEEIAIKGMRPEIEILELRKIKQERRKSFNAFIK